MSDSEFGRRLDGVTEYLRVRDLRAILRDLPDEMFVYLESDREIGHLVGFDPDDCFDVEEGPALLLVMATDAEETGYRPELDDS